MPAVKDHMTEPSCSNANSPCADKACSERGGALEVVMVPAGTDEVCCDGGNGALGHPKVYYRFENSDFARCGYCGREFERQQNQ
jgi:uncharacterized Zn-finger protein